MSTAVGRPKWELDTPALCVELNALECNIRKMADIIVKQNKVGWRPHTKGQKVPAVAWMEIAAGAFGVTCAKLGEAEVMAGAGIKDILIANQIVGSEKVTRLVNLRRHADVMVCVDSIENAREIDAAARAKGVRVRVLVECNNGLNRAGVALREPAVEFSKRLADLPGLQYAGVMAWEAHATTILEPAKKRAVIEESVGGLVETAKMARAAGLPADIVSCGGTGTYWVTATIPGVTEIQAGGGIFNDVHYSEHYGLPGHEFAMTVVSTVTSRPTPTRIITDAGEKTMSSKQAMPRPLGVGKVARVGLSAEHGRIELEEPNTELKVGDKVEWIVGYSDFTTFLHDEMYATRDGVVEQVWPVLGRGKLR
ncbi:MAG TPA: DSD1 family PLP-dependent enzyme [Chloroflexota bacterium]|jgi:D-serine deaminase-like pyridoxal phosphate-dependent protein|nr:DSD1 family PLP-dependent enzyme [Chloroflexota bacterium]